jgi:hypothetical protein
MKLAVVAAGLVQLVETIQLVVLAVLEAMDRHPLLQVHR